MANIKISELTTISSPSTSAKLVGVDNGETVQIPISSLPSGGGSGGGIIDVTELPTSPKTQTLYVVVQNEVVGAKLMFGYNDMTNMSEAGHIVEVVEALPSNPKVVTDVENSYTYIYWLTSDSSCYGYIDEELANAVSAPSGWYPVDVLLTNFGYPYGGVIESVDEISDESAFYILINKADKKNVYHYKDGAFVKLKSLPMTDDITATPNPCVFKTKELASLEAVGLDVSDDGEIVDIHLGVMDGIPCYAEVVEELPEVGEPMIDTTMTNAYMYYNRLDGSIYAYFTEELTALGDMPVGWNLFALPEDISIIYSLDEITDPYAMYGLGVKKPHLYFYDGEDWVEISTGFSMVHNPKNETITFVES